MDTECAHELVTLEYLVEGIKTSSTLPIPPSDPQLGKSVYLFAMPKSGSVLVNNIAAEIAAESGFTHVDFPAMLFSLGLSDDCFTMEEADFFGRSGYCLGGFRVIPQYVRTKYLDAARLAVVIRDPRDMIVSHYFSMANSHPSPGNKHPELLKMFRILQRMAREAGIVEYAISMAFYYRELFVDYANIMKRPNSIVLKYEEFVFNKLELARRIADLFGASIPNAVLKRIASKYDVAANGDDPAKHIRQILPGDCKRKLSAATVDRLNVILKVPMEQMKYRP